MKKQWLGFCRLGRVHQYRNKNLSSVKELNEDVLIFETLTTQNQLAIINKK